MEPCSPSSMVSPQSLNVARQHNSSVYYDGNFAIIFKGNSLYLFVLLLKLWIRSLGPMSATIVTDIGSSIPWTGKSQVFKHVSFPFSWFWGCMGGAHTCVHVCVHMRACVCACMCVVCCMCMSIWKGGLYPKYRGQMIISAALICHSQPVFLS